VCFVTSKQIINYKIKWKTKNTKLSEQFQNLIKTILESSIYGFWLPLWYLQTFLETEAKSITLTYIYMIAHFPSLVQCFQYKVAGLIHKPTLPLYLVKMNWPLKPMIICRCHFYIYICTHFDKCKTPVFLFTYLMNRTDTTFGRLYVKATHRFELENSLVVPCYLNFLVSKGYATYNYTKKLMNVCLQLLLYTM